MSKVSNSGDLVINKENMKKEEIKDTIVDGVCSDENKNTVKKGKSKKKPWETGYKEPPFYDEFRPHWGPGSKYKPWKYGK